MAWTAWVVGLFTAPGVALLVIEPWSFPVATLCFAHAWAVPSLQARRGARSVVAIGSAKSAASAVGAARTGAERIALGLLADLVGRSDLDLLARSGLAVHRGRLGTWLVGEQGAFLIVRPVSGRHGGTLRVRADALRHVGAPRARLAGLRRVSCWCVRVGDADGLPAADRVAHLLLALREDEEGFATVANLAFSGAAWRVGRHLEAPARHALNTCAPPLGAGKTPGRGREPRGARVPGGGTEAPWRQSAGRRSGSSF